MVLPDFLNNFKFLSGQIDELADSIRSLDKFSFSFLDWLYVRLFAQIIPAGISTLSPESLYSGVCFLWYQPWFSLQFFINHGSLKNKTYAPKGAKVWFLFTLICACATMVTTSVRGHRVLPTAATKPSSKGQTRSYQLGLALLGCGEAALRDGWYGHFLSFIAIFFIHSPGAGAININQGHVLVLRMMFVWFLFYSIKSTQFSRILLFSRIVLWIIYTYPCPMTCYYTHQLLHLHGISKLLHCDSCLGEFIPDAIPAGARQRGGVLSPKLLASHIWLSYFPSISKRKYSGLSSKLLPARHTTAHIPPAGFGRFTAANSQCKPQTL